jgi:hypothetical protein
MSELAASLHIEVRHAHRVVEVLLQLKWIGQLRPYGQDPATLYVLLIDIRETPLAPLAHALLLSRLDGTQVVWRQLGIERLTLKDVMSNEAGC